MNKQILRNKYKEIRKNILDKEKQDNIIFDKKISDYKLEIILFLIRLLI